MQDKPSVVAVRKGEAPSSEGKTFSINWLAIGALAAVVALAAGTYAYWQHSALYPSTDNAYVQANIVHIAPLVTDVVTEVDVTEYAAVKSGDVLVRLDPAPFEAALKAAETRLSVAQQQAGGAAGQSAAAKASIEQAQASVAQARLDLDHATIKAPLDGTVGKVRIRPGEIAKAGTSIFPLVDTSKWWVDANFKEGDLTRIKPGQKAAVHVDLFPSHEFTGDVEAISPASSSAFSLLPAENATGNWVKVAQRFPVRISLALSRDDPPLGLGASASVSVDTTTRDAARAAK
jgi:membrane fusion protein (multidrug efflux system)